MNAINARVNGQASYQANTQVRAAWREEMLDELLNQMRERQPAQAELLSGQQNEGMAFTRKGHYIDLYV